MCEGTRPKDQGGGRGEGAGWGDAAGPWCKGTLQQPSKPWNLIPVPLPQPQHNTTAAASAVPDQTLVTQDGGAAPGIPPPFPP